MKHLAGDDSLLSKEQIEKVFHYNATTGVFTRKLRDGTTKPTGFRLTHGYIGLCLGGKRYRAHRIAWIMAHGRAPEKELDHIDGNPANNAIANLREASRSENCRNTRARGYHFLAGKGYVARIQGDNNERIYLGIFPTEEKAALAYREAKTRLHGEFQGRAP